MRAEYLEDRGKTIQLLEKGTTMDVARKIASDINMVRRLGVRVPSFYEAVETEGRTGLAFDKPTGGTFTDWFGSSKYHWDKMVSLFAHEAHEMHLHNVPELDSVKDLIAPRLRRAGLSNDLLARTEVIMKKLPDGDGLCNWNHIPGNVIVSRDGPSNIRWEALRKGPYLADVARTIVLLKLEGEDVLAEAFRKEYMKICGRPDEELAAWMLIVAADKLADGIGAEKETLGKIVRANDV